MTKVLRSPTPTLLLKQGYLELIAHNYVQTDFEHLQGERLHNLSGQYLKSHHSERVFPDIQREPPLLQFGPIVSSPVTGHH